MLYYNYSPQQSKFSSGIPLPFSLDVLPLDVFPVGPLNFNLTRYFLRQGNVGFPPCESVEIKL